MTNQILDKTGLNWTVSKLPLFATSTVDELNIQSKLQTPFFGMFRDDNNDCLGTSKEGYEVSQNSDTVKLIADYFGDKLKIENVDGGSLKGGKRIYLTVKQDNLFKGSTAELEQRLIIRDSHDGSCAVTFGVQELVLVCTNGMTRWMDNRKSKIRHTATMHEKLSQFDTLYAGFLGLIDKRKDMFAAWQKTPVSEQIINDFLSKMNDCDTQLLESEFIEKFNRKKLNIVNAQKDSIQIELARQGANMWGLFNGITNYTTHKMGGVKKMNHNVENL